MSLDIALLDGEESVAEMNWLRNPFGLQQWAEDNYQIATGAGSRNIDLHYVTNHWAYDKNLPVDRVEFKRVVDEYAAVIEKLTDSYFVFKLSGYIQFVEPHLKLFPRENVIDSSPKFGTRIVGSKYHGDRIAIPQAHFWRNEFNLGDCTLAGYQAWFGELVNLANLLQEPRYRLYCSN